MQKDLSRSGLGALKKEEEKTPLPIPPFPPLPVPMAPSGPVGEPKLIPPIGGTISQITPPTPPPPAGGPPTISPVPPTMPVVPPIITPRPTPPVATTLSGTPPPAVAGGLPQLKIPPKIIPPKEIPAIPASPLPKAAPVWIKLGIVAIVVFLVTFFGLYIYWKIFVQGKMETPKQPAPQQPTTPTLPTTQPATTTPPLKFFNKLPNKAVTIDLAIKDTANLQKALQSETAIQEERESVKQIFITFQGKSIELAEFLNLMQIFLPQNFISNYENQYAFAYFSQKEGARTIIILKARDADLARTQMLEWEKNTLPSDVLPLFPTTLRNIQTPIVFKSYSLSGQPVRYVNVPVPFSSLNYSIYNNFLVITASSRAMFRIMGDLTGRGVSRTYLDALEASIDDFIK